RYRRFAGGGESKATVLPAERGQLGRCQRWKRHEMIHSILRSLTRQAPQPLIVAQFLPPNASHFIAALQRDQEQADELAERLVQAIRCAPERQQLVFGEYPLASRGARWCGHGSHYVDRQIPALLGCPTHELAEGGPDVPGEGRAVLKLVEDRVDQRLVDGRQRHSPKGRKCMSLELA